MSDQTVKFDGDNTVEQHITNIVIVLIVSIIILRIVHRWIKNCKQQKTAFVSQNITIKPKFTSTSEYDLL